jgi:hypothetical protein
MRERGLRIRRVRRYRVARYPSRHPGAKRGGSPVRRVLRASAAPALALGLGAAGGLGCDDGVTLAGAEPDAPDAGETTDVVLEGAVDDAGRDVERDDAAPPEDVAVPEDAGLDDAAPDYGWEGDMMPGTYYTRILDELAARELIARTVQEETGAPGDPCARPTLAERLLPEGEFRRPGVELNVDLLAPEAAVEETPGCAGGLRPAAGFEFKTDEEADDEDVSGRPAGVTDAEERVLAELDAAHRAHVRVLPSTDYAYTVIEYEDGWIDESDRARAERLLGDTIREILDGWRRDGCI